MTIKLNHRTTPPSRRLAWIVDQLESDKEAVEKLRTALSALPPPFAFEAITLSGQLATTASLEFRINDHNAKKTRLDVFYIHWVSHGGIANDSLWLQTAGTERQWPFARLRELVMSVDAETRVIAIDSCESAHALTTAQPGLNLLCSGNGRVPPTYNYTKNVAAEFEELSSRSQELSCRRWHDIARGVQRRTHDVNQAPVHQLGSDALVVAFAGRARSHGLLLLSVFALLSALSLAADIRNPCEQQYDSFEFPCESIHSLLGIEVRRQSPTPTPVAGQFYQYTFTTPRLLMAMSNQIRCKGRPVAALPESRTPLCKSPPW